MIEQLIQCWNSVGKYIHLKSTLLNVEPGLENVILLFTDFTVTIPVNVYWPHLYFPQVTSFIDIWKFAQKIVGMNNVMTFRDIFQPCVGRWVNLNLIRYL